MADQSAHKGIIRFTYEGSVSIADIEKEFDISWGDVSEWYIKHNTLNLRLANAGYMTYLLSPWTCTKYPSSIFIDNTSQGEDDER